MAVATNGSEKLVSSEIPVSTFRVGYGHIRAAAAINSALEKVGVSANIVDIASGKSLAGKFFKGLDSILGYCYNHFPQHFSKANETQSTATLKLISQIATWLDHGQFDLNHPGPLVIATHVAAADITRHEVFMLCLDPYANLYNTNNPHAITVTPDLNTAQKLKDLGQNKLVVTGPIVAQAISDSREHFQTRLGELSSGQGLRIVIATGGSLSHGNEIVNLTAAYIRAMGSSDNYSKIEKLSVVVGDSDTPQKGGNMKGRIEALLQNTTPEIRNKINIIYHQDAIKLVSAADTEMGLADIVHAKTGELVYITAGGKAFETFATNPSLGPQEINLLNYVKNLAVDDQNNHALESGLVNPDQEVQKILDQFSNGTLIKRLHAGLKVPANGANYIANLIKNRLQQINSQSK